jgi:hypothetical protein
MTGLTSQLSGVLVGNPGKAGPLPSGKTLDTTEAGAPTKGVFGAGGKISLDSFLEGGGAFNLGSAAATLFASNEEAAAAMSQAQQQSKALALQSEQDLLDAKQEELRGKEDTNSVMDNLIQTIAAQRLAFSTNGVDPSFGTPISVEASSRKLANLQLSSTREDALIRSLARRRQSAARMEESINVLSIGKQKAQGARAKGLAQVGDTLAEAAMRRKERG